MYNKDNIEEESNLVLTAIQAMTGALSPNFRQVVLVLHNKTVKLIFVLKDNITEDLNSIEDIVFGFECGLNADYEVASQVNLLEKSGYIYEGRTVYSMREEFL